MVMKHKKVKFHQISIFFNEEVQEFANLGKKIEKIFLCDFCTFEISYLSYRDEPSLFKRFFL